MSTMKDDVEAWLLDDEHLLPCSHSKWEGHANAAIALLRKHGRTLANLSARPGVDKPCTCHPDDNPPVPCQKKCALTDCIASARVGFAADAENWGNALNSAGWEFDDAYHAIMGENTPPKLFNNAKAIIRRVIIRYAMELTKEPK